MSICSRMKDVVMTISCPLLPSGVRELLEEEVAMITTGWVIVSYIGYKPKPLVGVQDATDAITYGLPALWLLCFCGCGFGMIAFPNLRIIC